MDKDPHLKKNIHRQVQEYQQKGFAHLATEGELAGADPKRIWYLPLGAVYNPKKPGKVRLIWDAAAKADGISLNSLLLPGSDLFVSLVSVQFFFFSSTSGRRQWRHQSDVLPDESYRT